jgi:PAS domain S-box-containing protein
MWLPFDLNKLRPILTAIFLLCIANFISKVYSLNEEPETTIRLTTGMAFMMFVWIPYRKWFYIFILQFGISLLFHLKLPFFSGLIISFSESITAFISAVFFIAVNEINKFRANRIIKILVSAAIGSLVGGFLAQYFLATLNHTDLYSFLWVTWFLSSLMGIILMAPIMMDWRKIKRKDINRLYGKQGAELSFLLVATLIITHLIFSNKLNDIYLSISFPYLILPFVFWAAVRFHPRVLSILLLGVSLLILHYIDASTIALRQTNQPFQKIVNSIQVFIIFTSVFSYIMAGIIQIRNEAEEKIKKLNEELEERVAERTLVLQHTLGALRQSEEQFRNAFETSIHGMALVSLGGNFLRVNQAFCDMIGYPMERLLKLNLRKITNRDDYIMEMKKMKKLMKGDISYYQVEKRLIHKDDLTVWVIESNSLIRAATGEPLHMVSQIVDIAERKQVEEQLRKYTGTLTVLLREVNHRVKNNLSALIGILHREEDKILNSDKQGYIQLLRELNSRIRGLATVHSMLSAGNWEPLEISQLCEQIVQAVLRGLPISKEVNLNVNKTKIKIGSNQAHHLTLVMNELATNSVKYGLGETVNGMIDINIQETDGHIHIIYGDNGPGYPEPIIQGDFNNASMGFELIRGIVTQSLGGELLLRNDNGAVTEILFENELN